MGCQRGSVLCIPQASLHAGTFEGGSELKDAGGVGRMLTSLFARYSMHGAVCLHAVRFPCALKQSTLLSRLFSEGFALLVFGPSCMPPARWGKPCVSETLLI